MLLVLVVLAPFVLLIGLGWWQFSRIPKVDVASSLSTGGGRSGTNYLLVGIDSREGIVADDPPGKLAERVADFEKREIEAVLAAHRGNLKPVYESLGLSRKTLWEKMQKHGLDKAQFGASAEGQAE